jgi:hypothetical protein
MIITMVAQKRKLGWYAIILVVIILAMLVLIIFQNVKITGNATDLISSITGYATEQNTVSNVSIEYYLSIALCTNLSTGILYGNVSTLPASDINGSHNYDGDYPTANESTYCVNVSTDSNTPVDFCIKANWDLNNSADDKILVGNQTWVNSTTTDVDTPALVNAVSLSTTYADAGYSIPIGSENWYRFWLDIPAGQASGDYDNSVYFKGVTQGNSC